MPGVLCLEYWATFPIHLSATSPHALRTSICHAARWLSYIPIIPIHIVFPWLCGSGPFAYSCFSLRNYALFSFLSLPLFLAHIIGSLYMSFKFFEASTVLSALHILSSLSLTVFLQEKWNDSLFRLKETGARRCEPTCASICSFKRESQSVWFCSNSPCYLASLVVWLFCH